MDYAQFVPELSSLVIAGVVSTAIAVKVSQAVVEEKLKSMKTTLDDHKKD
jgi:ABC-type transporter Mla maintaining outer membrane lipid asymmetry permease subunit MlaE